MPRARNAPKLWPGRALELDVDGVVGEAVLAAHLHQLVGEERADGAVGVDHRQLDLHPLALAEGRAGELDQLLIERALEPVVLALGVANLRLRVGLDRRLQHRAEIEAVGLPVLDRGVDLEHVDPAHHLVDGAEAERGHDRARVLGHHEQVVDDVLGLAGEALAQLGILGRDPHRAGVEVALAHHDAAERDQRRGGEAVLLGAEQRRDHDVAPGLELAVGLQRHARAQVVEHQRLVGLGQAQLPRQARVLDRGERRGAGAALVPGDEHVVGVRLDHARGDGADTDLRHQLHAHPRLGIRVLQVVDELLDVLDRVDVVVRRRRDESHARRRVARLGDDGVDLVARAARRPRRAWRPARS